MNDEQKAKARERDRKRYAAHREEILEARKKKYALRRRPTDEDRRRWREAAA